MGSARTATPHLFSAVIAVVVAATINWSSIVYCPIHTIAMLHAIYPL
jgi:hypothetical protein